MPCSDDEPAFSMKATFLGGEHQVYVSADSHGRGV
jgi:hypothetical protein